MVLFDPGLQPERTELAWRRTALSFAVGSLVAMRLLPDVLGSAWWALPGLAGLVASGWVWDAARRRATRVNRALVGGGDGPAPGGRPSLPDGTVPFALALIVTAAALVGVVALFAAAAILA
ncbi:DUF202 domain-containing protein [Microbacterium hominis]|uniref:DUF202 domain-containing protein n=1 Tax=Microbacterium hominis TaxID=162426 RepID=A0A7D4PNP5_9MICO|nr:DUF202 domain-containing protein [Microbacterium hominis]QKJ20450.1 DUF202 domain-containing protein [Microbacterium hominis]